MNKSDTLINSICQNQIIVSTFGCDAAIIPVIDEFAQGRITRKNSKYRRRYNLIKKIKSDWAEWYFDKYIQNKNTDERKTVKQMYRIINGVLNTY